jgi:hypothetical protein
MKKLVVLAVSVFCFIFVSCGNKPEATVEPATEVTEQKQDQPKHECCKMTEEQKAECEAFCKQWKDWENLSEDVKKDLVAKTKERFDKQDAEKEAKIAACKAEWANFDNLNLEEQKALIDKRMQCGKKCGKADKKCCKDGEKDGEKCNANKESK